MAQSCSSADVTGNTELANLRRARCHFRLKQAEELAQSYRDKLADLEARIRAIAPELEIAGAAQEAIRTDGVDAPCAGDPAGS
jgi:hypothetical protein